jgi:hypothetical protein
MPTYLRNATHFSVDCTVTEGHCAVLRENIHFVDDPQESTAVTLLQRKCGNVVITPDPVSGQSDDAALLVEMSMRSAESGTLGRPGMVMTSPQTMTTKLRRRRPAALHARPAHGRWARRAAGVGGKAVLRLGHAHRVVAVAAFLQLLICARTAEARMSAAP